MVNASLNWASIVGIVLAVCGAGLYFLRSFKPALARDYDVFFAAIGLLCGGILFFQGWRLDPILQFGQFLLAGTTVFFAYESVRLRGIATDQARRSSFFDDEPAPRRMPTGGSDDNWDENYDQFDEPLPLRRRFNGTNQTNDEDDFYRPRRTTRAAIPEEAASRRSRTSPDKPPRDSSSESSRRMARFNRQEDDLNSTSSFGQRRNARQEQRRGSRPLANQQTSRRKNNNQKEMRPDSGGTYSSSGRRMGVPQGSPMRSSAEDAAFSASEERADRPERMRRSEPTRGNSPSRFSDGRSARPSQRTSRQRDNSSRFDD